MTGDLLALLWAPFFTCLVLTGIYAYLGLHVITREVVFVDIVLAQLAALGATGAFLLDFDLSSPVSYGFALGAAFLGATVLALTRTPTRSVSQEAVIGVVYAVSAAASVLVLDRAPHGAEHLKADATRSQGIAERTELVAERSIGQAGHAQAIQIVRQACGVAEQVGFPHEGNRSV